MARLPAGSSARRQSRERQAPSGNQYSLYDLPTGEFLSALDELGFAGEARDNHLRAYRQHNSLFGQLAAGAAERDAERGRRPVAGSAGFLSRDAEGSVGFRPQGLIDALAGAERTITAPAQANLIPQQDMDLEALGTAGMAMTGGGAVAGPRGLMDYDPNTARIFAGRNARNADLDALERAQTMAARSVSRDDIWRDTGWFQGPDGQWRFEIDDSKAILRQKPADALNYGGEYGTNYGGGLLHQPLLGGSMRGVDYEPAYPFMADMDFRGSNTVRGAFYDDDGAIRVEAPSASEGLPVALHELQHAVQREEGFARGGTPYTAREMSREPLMGNAQALEDYIRNTERALASSGDPNGPFEIGLRESIKEAQDELAQLQSQMESRPATAFDAYQRLAGEAEARNVEARRSFTADQRRATPPWQTLDVPEDELIALGGRELDISANADEATGLLSMSAADTPAKQMARRILELRAAGRASEVTDDMMAAADPVYMFNNTPLPMDEASRLARAREMGFDTSEPWYHGTTHDFQQFGGGSTRNIEGHFGAGDYFTNAARDASDNYAGTGPDLTQRIGILAERLADEMDLDYNDPAVIARATAELKGGNDGQIMPVYTRGNTVSVEPSTRGRPTAMEVDYPYSADDFMDDAIAELGADADRFELRAYADDLAMEANAYEEPTGVLGDFINSIRRQGDEYGFDGNEALEPIQDMVYDGVGSAYDIDRALRSAEPIMYAEDWDTGGLMGNEILRQAFKDAGYDNIRMSANAQGWNMPIPEGTSHLISNTPQNIRSRFARFDPEFSHLSNLSAANASAPAGLLAMPAQEPQEQKLPFMSLLKGLLQ